MNRHILQLALCGGGYLYTYIHRYISRVTTPTAAENTVLVETHTSTCKILTGIMGDMCVCTYVKMIKGASEKQKKITPRTVPV